MQRTIILTAFAALVSCMMAPPICLSNIIELDAGFSFVSASIDGTLTQRCEALVTLDDPEYLPVTFTFDASHCDGPFTASFQMSPGFPAGDGYVFWQCSGQSPTCNRIRVKGGHKDASPALQRQGYVECASKFTGTPNLASSMSQTLTATSGVRAETGGGSLSRVSGKDATPTSSTLPQSTLPADSISYVATSSTTARMSRVWPTGARPTGAWPTGTASNIQQSTSTSVAINDATAINARQTAITSTIFTTILLTQTITSIATVC
ncbi:hypothetical protein ISF_07581 [Cordyceps fumosorosea ARSEF 2679]|uniref:AA1-like domain-containing protein n=1 Tax=Cordyceps fumosorosea (strain ARSEF 2679) TaxID=1081104 RepID=A0A167NV92_CORFA|nr:hypothetical protein ISF_07581 [Cordyceps fumosorosea ARSEF 2679]OAA55983.1 hypothetical protein ISF_07581 [Cordyceps fumosorosea ARSEF 2679]